MKANSKKRFKNSKLFAAIKKVAPNVLDGATDVIATAIPALAPLNVLIDSAINAAQENDDEKAVVELSYERDEYLKELDEYFEELKSARMLYETSYEQADKIANIVIRFNLLIVVFMVLMQCGVIIYIDGKVAAVITGVIGTVTGALLQERNTVINFFFGSSQGSKDKDKMI